MRGYRGDTAERAEEWSGKNEHDLSHELALSRALLQRALDTIEEGSEDVGVKQIAFLMEKVADVAKMAKLNIDARAKVAMTEADLKLMQSRIISAMVECVPTEKHAQFLGLIAGRGTDAILKRISVRGDASTGVPEEVGEDEDPPQRKKAERDYSDRGGKFGRGRGISRV